MQTEPLSVSTLFNLIIIAEHCCFYSYTKPGICKIFIAMDYNNVNSRLKN